MGFLERPISKPNPGTSISSTQRLRVPTAGDSWFFVANSTATGSWKAQPQIQNILSKSWRENDEKIHEKDKVMCEKIWETQLFVVFSS